MMRVLIADDEELTRTGLHALLSREPDIDVVGGAADGAEVLVMAAELKPDLVLMDVRMPEVDGIEATRRLRGTPDAPKVVVITTFENDEYVYDALLAGASGFLLKRSRSAEIAHALRLVASGDTLLFPDAVRRLAAARPVAVRADGPPLTARETDVLRLMAAGLSNGDIAARLYVTVETVKTHVGNVLMKLGADNRTQAVVFAYENGVVVPGER
ncbi:DNA-binding response regulator [Actinorhabdospora filicis]|uniref:DNA-binding response regulator n=1 Tax=Actinorhabdospora filicis TaxID=1785913 RepID=A0A9W6SK48_9ACTN|nr:response regulator transcription factor [Actinorhabdospora filicis]GLZ77109.1 DNA-binding response regulator [Actinorhabdospora filicis]